MSKFSTIIVAASAVAISIASMASQAGTNPATDSDPCPAQLVNFWKTYAASTNNPDAVPEFLVRNDCVRTGETKAFHYAMAKRFDDPENPLHVDALYAQLDWTNGYSYNQ